MLIINAKHNSVWTSTVYDNVLLSTRVWLSGLRLYLQSDRDKTLQPVAAILKIDKTSYLRREWSDIDAEWHDNYGDEVKIET